MASGIRDQGVIQLQRQMLDVFTWNAVVKSSVLIQVTRELLLTNVVAQENMATRPPLANGILKGTTPKIQLTLTNYGTFLATSSGVSVSVN